MNSLQLQSPAKLNLFLHVVGQRADGYHLLQSVFILIDWCDEVHLRRHTGGIHRLGPMTWAPDQDLGVRAAHLLKAEGLRLGRLSEEAGCDIRIHKQIPAGAGLGGGSANAATVLLGLNALWGLDFSLDHLKTLGLRLGADVPFFLHGEAAFAQGVGESLQSLPIRAHWFVVAVPPVHVSTGPIFQDPTLTRDTKVMTMRPLAEPALAPAWSFGHNDLAPVACRLFPAVHQLIQSFQAASRSIGWSEDQVQGQIRMSGSGGSVFASCESESEAQALHDALQAVCVPHEEAQPDQTVIRVCEQLGQSPVHLQVPLR